MSSPFVLGDVLTEKDLKFCVGKSPEIILHSLKGRTPGEFAEILMFAAASRSSRTPACLAIKNALLGDTKIMQAIVATGDPRAIAQVVFAIGTAARSKQAGYFRALKLNPEQHQAAQTLLQAHSAPPPGSGGEGRSHDSDNPHTGAHSPGAAACAYSTRGAAPVAGFAAHYCGQDDGISSPFARTAPASRLSHTAASWRPAAYDEGGGAYGWSDGDDVRVESWPAPVVAGTAPARYAVPAPVHPTVDQAAILGVSSGIESVDAGSSSLPPRAAAAADRASREECATPVEDLRAELKDALLSHKRVVAAIAQKARLPVTALPDAHANIFDLCLKLIASETLSLNVRRGCEKLVASFTETATAQEKQDACQQLATNLLRRPTVRRGPPPPRAATLYRSPKRKARPAAPRAAACAVPTEDSDASSESTSASSRRPIKRVAGPAAWVGHHSAHDGEPVVVAAAIQLGLVPHPPAPNPSPQGLHHDTLGATC